MNRIDFILPAALGLLLILLLLIDGPTMPRPALSIYGAGAHAMTTC